MKILKNLLFACWFLFLMPQAMAQSFLSSSQQLLVVVYGDILTSNSYLPAEQTFPAQLDKKLKAIGFEVNVLAMGDSEFTSSTALEKLPSLVGAAPDVVIIQLGETDIKRNFSAFGFINNLQKIIDTLKSKGIYVIIMGARVPESADAAYAKKINEFLSSTARKTPLYYTLDNVAGSPERTISDNYRPNAKGVEIMVNGVYIMVDSGLRWRLDVINKMRLKQNKIKP